MLRGESARAVFNDIFADATFPPEFEQELTELLSRREAERREAVRMPAETPAVGMRRRTAAPVGEASELPSEKSGPANGSAHPAGQRGPPGSTLISLENQGSAARLGGNEPVPSENWFATELSPMVFTGCALPSSVPLPRWPSLVSAW